MWPRKKYTRHSRASLSKTSKFIHIQTVSGRDAAVIDPKGPDFVLPCHTSPFEIGKRLKECLHASRRSSPSKAPELYNYAKIAEIYKARFAHFMSEYEYKTQQALYLDMRRIDFEVNDNSIFGKEMVQRVPGRDGWVMSDKNSLAIHIGLDESEVGEHILEFLAT